MRPAITSGPSAHPAAAEQAGSRCVVRRPCRPPSTKLRFFREHNCPPYRELLLAPAPCGVWKFFPVSATLASRKCDLPLVGSALTEKSRKRRGSFRSPSPAPVVVGVSQCANAFESISLCYSASWTRVCDNTEAELVGFARCHCERRLEDVSFHQPVQPTRHRTSSGDRMRTESEPATGRFLKYPSTALGAGAVVRGARPRRSSPSPSLLARSVRSDSAAG
jgi:hypothetical protein